MKLFVVLSGLLAVAMAKPGLLAYNIVLPGAPIGLDGRVVDTPEVSLAKAAHAAAHINEKLNHNAEVLRSADFIYPAAAPVYAAPAALPVVHAAPLAYAAPLPAALPIASHATLLATDGRPLDTPEVAAAKAAHAAAHINEQLTHAKEATRNAVYA
ncbi:cuticle protein 18.7-like [Trichogramma pretiosum]|uniref:cuticle protein 18.7-like n=1 Tax=Trichogramma pretiosum TaxID=7493 RepID=UPI0006C94FB5|nr:cuticle protein 18.7-like [Trichogramma pretiosum]